MKISPLVLLQFRCKLLPRLCPSLLVFLLIGVVGTSAVSAQTLTDEDRRQIQSQAERQVNNLAGLLNLITNPRMTGNRKSIMESNYDRNNAQRVFENENVIIHDDWNPQNSTDWDPAKPNNFPEKISVPSYLNRATLLYEYDKPENVRFSSLRVTEIDQRTYVYARVVFISQFFGKYANNSTLKYPRIVRVAEVVAEKVNNRWVTKIGGVYNALKEEIELAYGSADNVDLIVELETTEKELDRDSRFITQKIQEVLDQIGSLKPDEVEQVVINDDVQIEAAKLAQKADSLARLAQDEVDAINRYQGSMKIQMVAIDSLVKKADSKSIKVAQQLSGVKVLLDSLRRATAESADALSRTEAGASYVIILAGEVKRIPNATDPDSAKIILQKYDQSSAAAREVESSAEDANNASEKARLRLEGIKNAEKQAGKAEQESAAIQQEIEKLYGRAVAQQQKAESANRKAAIYTQAADSLISRIESLIGGGIGQFSDINIRLAAIKALIDQSNFEIRDKSSRATNLVRGLVDAAKASGDPKLLERALELMDVVDEIQDTEKRADAQYDEAILRAQTGGEADTLILKIISQKQSALNTIVDARKARSRAKRTRNEAGDNMSEVRAQIDSSRLKQRDAVVNRALLEGFVEEGEALYTDSRDAKLKAGARSKFANAEVNDAFRQVAQVTLAHRRHHTSYIGINYNFFRSYTSGNSANPFKRQLGNGISGLESFGISFYNRVGFFVSGYGRFTDKMPSDADQGSNLNQIRLAQFEKDVLNNVDFEPHRLDSAKGNGGVINAGLYISPLNHLYIMAGVSHFSGYHWNQYEANYPKELRPADIQPKPNTTTYIADFNSVRATNLILGASVVYPFWQFETGYNFLQKSIFINGGINIPLRKTFAYRKTRSISREEYDRIVRDYLKP
ncbi:MAG: hypothetical protein AB8F95_16335 [Bacteroidia bacterium]